VHDHRVTALLPKAIAALLRQAGVSVDANCVNLVAVALAETGGEVGYASGTRRGLWGIDDSRGYDRNRMVADAAYAAGAAATISRQGADLSGWASWLNGRYLLFLNAARQAQAQAASVTGSILDEFGQYVPGSYFGALAVAPGAAPARPDAPPAGVGTPLAAAGEQQFPLTGLRVTGTQLTGDLSNLVIGAPAYTAAMSEIPNLTFTVADPQGDLLWQKANLWTKGARVEYLDLDLRIDEIKFEPGGHGTGQISIVAIDAMVYALQQLRGARVDKGGSPTTFIAQELRLAGFDPARYYLGESLPTQTEIARDVLDPNNQGAAEPPSSWTTILRLAKERGKRVFISGRKLIFGSTAFAANWTAPGTLRIGWHNSPEGERWLNLPTATQTSSGSKTGTTEVQGQVPLNRARYFRPGVSVTVHNTPAIAAGDRKFVCASVAFNLARDTDGAAVTLVEPIELEPEKK